MESLYDKIRSELCGPNARSSAAEAVSACISYIELESKTNETLHHRLHEGEYLWGAVSKVFMLNPDSNDSLALDLKRLVGFETYDEYLSSSFVPKTMRLTLSGLVAHTSRLFFKRGVESHLLIYSDRAEHLDKIIERLGYDEARRQGHRTLK